MDRSERGNLTVGSPGKKLIAFAIPIIIINLMQAVYNVADMVIIGHFVGAAGMSAVSIGGQITTVVLVVIVAIANGAAAIIGQNFGAGNADAIGRTLRVMYSLAIIVALALTAAVICFASPILRFLNTPAESFDGAVSYLNICMAGTVFVYTYNCFYAVLRGIGESVVPMKIMLLTTVENIVLDLVFVAVLEMGAAGAAAATVLSQLTSAALICRHVCRLGYYRFGRDGFSLDPEPLGALMRLCAPQVVQMVLTNSSFMLIGGLINYFGVNASAAAGAVTKIWNFTVLAGQAMMAAMITMTAQNYPRKAYERILKALGAGCMLVTAVAAVITLLCELSPEWMLSLFTDEQAVVESGIRYLRFFAIGFIVENIMFCMFGTLTGAGHTMVPFCCAVISAYLVRYLLAWVFSRMTALGFDGIAIAYSIAPFISCAICSVFIASGRWKKSRIKVS